MIFYFWCSIRKDIKVARLLRFFCTALYCGDHFVSMKVCHYTVVCWYASLSVFKYVKMQICQCAGILFILFLFFCPLWQYLMISIHYYLSKPPSKTWSKFVHSAHPFLWIFKELLMDVWQFIIISKQCYLRNVNQIVTNNEEY